MTGVYIIFMDYFWNTFLKSGSIEAYLAHKELERARKAKNAERNENRQFSHEKKR